MTRHEEWVEVSKGTLENVLELLDSANEVAKSWTAANLCRREAIKLIAIQMANYMEHSHNISRREAMQLIMAAIRSLCHDPTCEL